MTLAVRSTSVPREITVAQLAWVVAGGIFIALRLAALLSAPVAGAELASLSGAWEAHAGHADERFIPTLFQAVASWTFVFTNSEVPARFLALAASCTIPFAFYRLREVLTEPGALVALLVLAIDPSAVLLGGTAWHGAFDMALVAWLLAFVFTRAALPDWAFAVAGFAFATAGELVLPALLGLTVVRLLRQEYPRQQHMLWAAGGVLAGWAVAWLEFGYGAGDPVLSPLAGLARGFEDNWSTETTGTLLALYSLPLFLAGLAAAVFYLYECWRDDVWPRDSIEILAVAGVSVAWVVVASRSHTPAPLAGAAVPLAMVIGLVAPAIGRGVARVPWLYAIAPAAGCVVALLVAEAYLVDWARLDKVGTGQDQLIVAGLTIAAIACLGLLASGRRTAPAILVPAATIALLGVLPGTAGVAFGGPNEPMPSPASSVQGNEVREIALAARRERGGQIVIHSDFREESTWSMRDSGEIVYASRVPADAAAVVWPVTLAAPEGFSVVEGRWSFREVRHGPDGGFLDYLRWLSNRNILKNSANPMGVYLKPAQ